MTLSYSSKTRLRSARLQPELIWTACIGTWTGAHLMIEYLRAHWRGEHLLAQSYWVNGVLVTILVVLALAIVDPLYDSLSLEAVIATSVLIITFTIIISVWQWVGLWRSATKTSDNTGRYFWSAVAKLTVIIGALRTIFEIATIAGDLANVASVLRDPSIADHTVERIGPTDLLLTGAINDHSVSEVLTALEDPAIVIFRVNSHGGLLEPAIRLARHIRQFDVMVMAEGQCISACVMLLAASHRASIVAGTVVTFHRGESLVDFSNPTMRAEATRTLQEADATLREFGVPAWVVQQVNRQEFWTPTLNELTRMELIKYVHDLESPGFVLAVNYCLTHPAQCNR